MHSTRYSNMTDSELMREASLSDDEFVSAIFLLAEKWRFTIDRIKTALEDTEERNG